MGSHDPPELERNLHPHCQVGLAIWTLLIFDKKVTIGPCCFDWLNTIFFDHFWSSSGCNQLKWYIFFSLLLDLDTQKFVVKESDVGSLQSKALSLQESVESQIGGIQPHFQTKNTFRRFRSHSWSQFLQFLQVSVNEKTCRKHAYLMIRSMISGQTSHFHQPNEFRNIAMDHFRARALDMGSPCAAVGCASTRSTHRGCVQRP